MASDTTSMPIRRAAPRWSVRRKLIWIAGIALTVLIYAHAWTNTGSSISELVSGLSNMGDIIRRSFPPAVRVLHESLTASIVTLDTALLGTTAALVISLLLTPLAARNLSPHRVLYEASRLLIAVTRTIPSFIFALYFVTAVGLGPFAAVLALAVHSIGTLGKLFAETVEEMDTGPVDALRAAGASRLQVFLHAVLPGVATAFVGLVLYRFDVNVRDSLVTGIVGGGGIGFLIFNSMQLFQYREVSMELIVLLGLLLAVERISSILRARIN